jgi:hypothetical protein
MSSSKVPNLPSRPSAHAAWFHLPRVSVGRNRCVFDDAGGLADIFLTGQRFDADQTKPGPSRRIDR